MGTKSPRLWRGETTGRASADSARALSSAASSADYQEQEPHERLHNERVGGRTVQLRGDEGDEGTLSSLEFW